MAGVVDYVVKVIERDLLPKYPNVDGVVGLNHLYGCGVAINAPAAVVPIRTIHNIALNPNFGGEVMVIGLGCEKLQPERLLEGTEDVPAIAVERASIVRLQDEQHVGFKSMVDDILRVAERHLTKLNQRQRETCRPPSWSSGCSVAAAMRFPASRQTRRWVMLPICWYAAARPSCSRRSPKCAMPFIF